MPEREKIRDELEEVLEEKEKQYGEEEKEDIIEETIERLGEQTEEKISRRNFLKIAGLGVGGLAFSSLTSAGWIRNSTGANGLAKALSNNNSAGGYSLDMNQNEILNMVIDKRSGSDPGSPVEGQIWLRTDI